MQYDQVRKFAEAREKARLCGEVDVRFVEHHDSCEFADDPFDGRRGEAVGCRVVRGTEPQQAGVGIRCGEQLVRVERKILLELYFADLHVVDFGGHFVHAVSRGDGYGVVHFRFAEYPVNQIYRFVRAVAHEDAFHRDALDLRKACLERLLARVGVAVDSVVVRIFVGVEGYAQLGALVIVARGGVGREVADILPYEIAYVHGLSVCAAGAEFVSAAVCRPFGDGSLPV